MFKGRSGSYAEQLPVVDAIIEATYGVRGVMVDAEAGSLNFNHHSAVLDFLVMANVIPKNAPIRALQRDFGFVPPSGLKEHINAKYRVPARLTVIAAVKAHGPARGAMTSTSRPAILESQSSRAGADGSQVW